MERPKPTGFVGRCMVCGKFLAGLDITRMDRKEASKELGSWLADGLIIEPRFGSWQESIGGCKCYTQEEPA